MANSVTIRNVKRSRWFFDLVGDVPKDAPKGTKGVVEQTIILGDREARTDKGESPAEVTVDLATWAKIKAQHSATLKKLEESGEISIYGATL